MANIMDKYTEICEACGEKAIDYTMVNIDNHPTILCMPCFRKWETIERQAMKSKKRSQIIAEKAKEFLEGMSGE